MTSHVGYFLLMYVSKLVQGLVCSTCAPRDQGWLRLHYLEHRWRRGRKDGRLFWDFLSASVQKRYKALELPFNCSSVDMWLHLAARTLWSVVSCVHEEDRRPRSVNPSTWLVRPLLPALLRCSTKNITNKTPCYQPPTADLQKSSTGRGVCL